MLLQFCALGVTMSWDEGFPGARASRPHQACHSLGHLPHLDQPGTAPWRSFDLADAVPADRVAACSIALKLSGGQRNSMRAGRPRSQAMPPRRCGGECLAGDFSILGNSRLPASRPPALPCGSIEEKRPIVPWTRVLRAMLCPWCGCHGMKASRERGRPARTKPGTTSAISPTWIKAPWRSFDLADAVPADRVAACSIALKLSGGQRNSMRAGRPRSRVIRDRMRAGRPRSQAMPPRRCGGECLAGDFSESPRAPLGKLPFTR